MLTQLSTPRPAGFAIGLLLSVSLMAAAGADEVRLVGGDTLIGVIVERTDEAVIFDHPLFGRMTIPREQVTSAVTDAEREAALSAPPAETGAVETTDAAPSAEAELPAPKPAPTWKSRFTLAASGSLGNTDTQSFTAGITSRRESETMNTLFDTAYYFGARDGDRNENKFTAGLRNDWLMPDSPWFIFAQGRYDYDQFQSWDHRVSGHAGLGYQWIDDENFKLAFRAGLGAIKEWGSDNDNLRPEGLLGTDLWWRISEKQTFEFGATAYPDLDDGGEFRTVTRAAWNALIDESLNLSLSAGLLHEYQSQVDSGKKRNDLKIFAGLSFDF